MNAQYTTVFTSFTLPKTSWSTSKLTTSSSRDADNNTLVILSQSLWCAELTRDRTLERGQCVWRIPSMTYDSHHYTGVVATIKYSGIVLVVCPAADVQAATYLTACIRKKMLSLLAIADNNRQDQEMDNMLMYVHHRDELGEEASNMEAFSCDYDADNTIPCINDIHVTSFTVFLYPYLDHLHRIHRLLAREEEEDNAVHGRPGRGKRLRSSGTATGVRVNVRGESAVQFLTNLFTPSNGASGNNTEYSGFSGTVEMQAYLESKREALTRYVVSHKVHRLARREGLQVILDWRSTPLPATNTNNNSSTTRLVKANKSGSSGAMPAPLPALKLQQQPISDTEFQVESSADFFFMSDSSVLPDSFLNDFPPPSSMPEPIKKEQKNEGTDGAAYIKPSSTVLGSTAATSTKKSSNDKVASSSINCIIFNSGKAQVVGQSEDAVKVFTQLVLIPFVLCNGDLFE